MTPRLKKQAVPVRDSFINMEHGTSQPVNHWTSSPGCLQPLEPTVAAAAQRIAMWLQQCFTIATAPKASKAAQPLPDEAHRVTEIAGRFVPHAFYYHLLLSPSLFLLAPPPPFRKSNDTKTHCVFCITSTQDGEQHPHPRHLSRTPGRCPPVAVQAIVAQDR